MTALAVLIGAIVAVVAACYGLDLLSCRRDVVVAGIAALVFAPALVPSTVDPTFRAPSPGSVVLRVQAAAARVEPALAALGLLDHPSAQAAPPPAQIAAAVPQLVAGLEATPGCLGVELVRTASGKQAVFAWFENKRALMRWYASDAHLRAVQAVFPGHQLTGTTLKDVPDDAGPILSIASFVQADPAQASAGGAPFSQIAIEHYTPLAGGIAVGGRFAPAALKVPGLREIALPLAPATDRK